MDPYIPPPPGGATQVSNDEFGFLRRDLSHLPIDQRGHDQIPDQDRHQPLVHQGGILNDGREEWFDRADIIGGSFSCGWCDAYPAYRIRYGADGAPVAIVAATECTLPRGQTITFDLAVPSGRVVVNDSLRPLFDIPLRHEADAPGYNSIAGQALYCAEMAAIGCAYGPVGNTDPSLVRIGEDRYVIASSDVEAEPGEEGHLQGEHLARISTSLWAYSIADYDHWLAAARAWAADSANQEENDGAQSGLREWVENGEDATALPRRSQIVDLAPGTYRFTHHTGEFGFDERPWPLVFADIERIA